MSQWEFDHYAKGRGVALDVQMERLAWVVMHLLSPHSKRKIRVADLLPRDHLSRRKKREKQGGAPPVGSREEFSAFHRARKLKEREREWLASAEGKRIMALAHDAITTDEAAEAEDE